MLPLESRGHQKPRALPRNFSAIAAAALVLSTLLVACKHDAPDNFAVGKTPLGSSGGTPAAATVPAVAPDTTTRKPSQVATSTDTASTSSHAAPPTPAPTPAKVAKGNDAPHAPGEIAAAPPVANPKPPAAKAATPKEVTQKEVAPARELATKEPATREPAPKEPAPKPAPNEPVSKSPSVPTLPPRPAAPRTVLVRSTPPGAHVRLRSSSGKTYEPTSATPVVFTVPPDVYSWEVDLRGFLPDQSGQRNRVDLLAKDADTLQLALTLDSGRDARLKSANDAFDNDNCPQAITIYQTIERPGELGGSVGRTWLDSRGRLAQCQGRLRQYDPAIATYQQILDAEPFQWKAKYELGRMYCEKKEFTKGADVLRELDGPYSNNVPQDRRQAVMALGRYGRAICQLKDYQSQARPDDHAELRDPAIRLFDEFIFAAENLLKGDLPADIRTMLARNLDDATSKRAELKGG